MGNSRPSSRKPSQHKAATLRHACPQAQESRLHARTQTPPPFQAPHPAPRAPTPAPPPPPGTDGQTHRHGGISRSLALGRGLGTENKPVGLESGQSGCGVQPRPVVTVNLTTGRDRDPTQPSSGPSRPYVGWLRMQAHAQCISHQNSQAIGALRVPFASMRAPC